MSEVLKVIAGGLVALVCAYIGVLIKRRYRQREKFFLEAVEYLNCFERELTFKKTPVPEIDSAFLKAHDGDFSKLVSDKSQILKKSVCTYLKTAEKESVMSMLSGLGKSDYKEQVAYVQRWKSEMKEWQEKASFENKKYGGMYFKLCVLLGIALLILIV